MTFLLDIALYVEVDDHLVLVTTLIDEDGDATLDFDDAEVAIGQYLTGPRAGWWCVLDDLAGLTVSALH